MVLADPWLIQGSKYWETPEILQMFDVIIDLPLLSFRFVFEALGADFQRWLVHELQICRSLPGLACHGRNAGNAAATHGLCDLERAITIIPYAPSRD